MKSAKIIKKVLRVFGYTLAVLCLLLLASYAAIRTETVQTCLTQRLAARFSEKLETTVSIDRVYLAFFTTLRLEGLYVEDQHGDTLLHAPLIEGAITDFALDSNYVHLASLQVHQPTFYLQHHRSDTALNLAFILQAFASDDTTSGIPPHLRCDVLTLEQLHFRYTDQHDTLPEPGVNFSDLDVQHMDLVMRDVHWQEDTIQTFIEALSLEEHSGFVLHNLTTEVRLTPDKMDLAGLSVQTPFSQVRTDLLFQYDAFGDFAAFDERINMNYQVANARVHARDLAYFVPDLQGLEAEVLFSGKVRGKVGNLRGRNLNIRFADRTVVLCDMDLIGLPNTEETYVFLNIDRLVTNRDDLVQVPLPPFNQRHFLEVPGFVNTLGDIRFTGSFTGFFSDFVAYGDFYTDRGQVRTDINLKQDPNTGVPSYSGSLSATDFDIGTFLQAKPLLDQVSLQARIKGRGFDRDHTQMTLDGEIAALDFKGYRYRNLDVNGEFAHNQFDGQVMVNDPNLNLEFDGSIDLATEVPDFRFQADVRHARPTLLQWMKRDTTASLSAKLAVNFSGSYLEDLVGTLAIDALQYREKGEEVALEHLEASAVTDSTGQHLRWRSDWTEGWLVGHYQTEQFKAEAEHFLGRIAPAYFGTTPAPEARQDFQLSLNLKNTHALTAIFMPALQLKDSARITGRYQGALRELQLDIASNGMTWEGREFDNVQLRVNSRNDVLEVDADLQAVAFSDSIRIENVHLFTKGLQNQVQFGLNWRNNSVRDNHGEVSGLVSLIGPKQFEVSLVNTEVVVADSVWRMNNSNRIRMDSTRVIFQNLVFGNDYHSAVLNGMLSERRTDKLRLALSHFDLSYLNLFTHDLQLHLEGMVNGELNIADPYHNMIVDATMELWGIKVNGREIGTGAMASIWDSQKQSMQVHARLDHGGQKRIGVNGFYYPNEAQNSLDLRVGFDSLELNTFTPWVEGYISDISGRIDGDITLRGEPARPLLNGRLMLREADFMVDYLKTRYFIDRQEVVVEEDYIGINAISVLDVSRDTAIVTGTILHDNYAGLNFDVGIEMQRFQTLNTGSKDNNLFYGSAYLTGLFNVSGFGNSLLLEMDARTDRGTRLAIPLSSPEEISEIDFIRFVSHDTAQVELEEQVDLTGIEMDLDLEMTEEAQVEIIFDDKVGDKITAAGSGEMQLEINTLGEFNIYGEYLLAKGDYLFTLQNIINKKFDIQRGGAIAFNGSPYDAQVDMQAIYRLRTTPYDLVQNIDTSETFRSRTPVDCKLELAGNLMKPGINFDIDLPNLGESSIPNEILDNLNDQEKNQQIFSLLLINRFLPPQGGLYTKKLGSRSTSEVLSNQLSNWLSQISSDVDIGVNYRPGDDISNEEVEVIVSTQLFNDRVTVETNVGVNGNNEAKTRSSNMVGDFKLEYKINEKLRAKVYNQSNEFNMTNSNSSPYTQGVGVFYREEFNTFGDFVCNLFRSREKCVQRRRRKLLKQEQEAVGEDR